MDQVAPEITREIERVLEKKLSTLSGEDYSTAGGVESIVKILNLAGRDTEEQIIKTLENEDPELAEEIESRLRVFGKPCRRIWGRLTGKVKGDIPVKG
jgi:flagellar motor switch protein FliG